MMKIYEFDVLCIGSGVSGLMAAISASKHKKVCVLSKEPLSWGNTRISGGIIASNGDSGLQADMFNSGQQLNQANLVEALLSNSEDIHDVIESWGHLYMREEGDSSKRMKIKPGGHTTARTFVSSYQGISLANVLRYKLLSHEITILEERIVCQLLKRDGRVYGALAFHWTTGEWSMIVSNQTILASGGAGMLYYPHTDNMRSATGDGYALALQAGAKLIDMEQVQFIPFGVASTEAVTGLEIGDTAAAGPYGVLKNHQGKVFLDDLPTKTREYVSRKIALEMKKGDTSPHGGVWLDPTDNLTKQDGMKAWENAKLVGSLDAVKFVYGSSCYQWKAPFEVIPTQHYMMGGIQIDEKGRTEIRGLMAVGEVAGGIHGAGRLGSMSLFEGLVFGRLVGEEAAKSSQSEQPISALNEEELLTRFKDDMSAEKGDYSPFRLKKELAKVMWEYVGIIRDEQGLNTALLRLNELERQANSLRIDWSCKSYNYVILNAVELKFMLTTAKAVLMSALKRKESRGSHFRIDYPSSHLSEIFHTSTRFEKEQLLTELEKEFV